MAEPKEDRRPIRTPFKALEADNGPRMVKAWRRQIRVVAEDVIQHKRKEVAVKTWLKRQTVLDERDSLMMVLAPDT